MKLIDYILIAILIVVFCLALSKVIKDRKNGSCSGCGGECSKCKKKK